MKRFAFITALLFLISVKIIFAGNQDELILQFNNQSIDKRYSEIEKIISSSKGIVNFEFCKSLSCFMIKINRTEMPDESRMLNELKQAGFSFDIKSDATIAQVKSACSDSAKNKTD